MAASKKIVKFPVPEAEHPENWVKTLTKAEMQRLRGVVFPMRTLQAQAEQLVAQHATVSEALARASADYTEVYVDYGLDPAKVYEISPEGDVVLQE